METVTIKDVNRKDSGWFDISLDGDDRVISTKEQKLADIAEEFIGNEVAVEVNTRVNGSFTNHYLQNIDGTAATPPKKNGRAASSAPTAARTAPGKDAATQERIARQWAFGRATELLVASDREFSFPLDKETQADLKLQAQALLDATKA